MSLKQDRTGTRNSEDLRRRINVGAIAEANEKVDASTETVNKLNTQVITLSNQVKGLNDSVSNTRESYVSTNNQTFTEEQKTRARNNIGAGNSSFSGSYNDLTNKPTIPTKLSDLTNDSDFVEDSNYVHTDNNYTTTEKNKLSGLKNITVDSAMSSSSTNPVQNKVVKAYIDANSGGGSSSSSYSLSSYKVSNLSILRSSCEVKNDRVCINFVGTLPMNANTTTTLFNLPSGLRPSVTKDFVVFGQSSNTDGYIGYGYVTDGGLLQVRFNEAISSYIRFSAVYDL